jgi:hypothetical protein
LNSFSYTGNFARYKWRPTKHWLGIVQYLMGKEVRVFLPPFRKSGYNFHHLNFKPIWVVCRELHLQELMEHLEKMTNEVSAETDAREKILIEFEDGQIKRIWSTFKADVEILNREQIYTLEDDQFGKIEEKFFGRAKNLKQVFP